MLSAAVLAPNHRLTEPWRFYVLGPAAREAYGRVLGARKAKKIDDAAVARTTIERVAAEHRALPAMIAVAIIQNANPEILEEDRAAVMMAMENRSLPAVATGLGSHIKTGAVRADPAARAAVGARDDGADRGHRERRRAGRDPRAEAARGRPEPDDLGAVGGCARATAGTAISSDLMATDLKSVIDFIHVNRDRYVSELKNYLAIPSISALPQHAADVKRCAEWTAAEMRRIGLENVRLIETPGNPVVYGDWLHAAGAPTILFYGHYDVQPVDPVNLWESPPFEATVRDGEIYARGAADDKGQVFMHFKAIEAYLQKGGTLPVNVKVIVEGEEEVGSVNLDNFVKGNKPMLAADVVVISDSAMFDRGVPSICYSLRGIVYSQIDVRGTKTDLHSGVFGGAVVNPNMALVQILAQMKDRGGRIKIPGFYEDVLPLTDAERAEWQKLPFNERKYKKDLGAPKLFGESGYTTLERVWGRPTLEINGILGGFTGEGAKTVIPAVSMAKVSMRLVPNQVPQKIEQLFEAYVKKVAPKSVDVKVTHIHNGKPWITVYDNPFVQAAGRAIEHGFGKTPVFCREGGSIPVVSTFQEVLGVPAVLFGVGLPDENAHAPNERLDLSNFHNGVVASAALYKEIAATK